MWSGVGTPKAETEGRSHRCSYATPHEVITSYRLPDKGCLAFISHCFLWAIAKLAHFFHFVSVWDNPFPAPTFYRCTLWLLWSYTTPLQHKQFNAHSYNGWWEGGWKGVRELKRGTDNKYNTILLYWPTIGLYFIRYKRANYLHLMCCKWRNSSTQVIYNKL